MICGIFLHVVFSGAVFGFIQSYPDFLLQSFVHPRFLGRYRKMESGFDRNIPDVEKFVHPSQCREKVYLKRLCKRNEDEE
jgi:hypothetical protein